MKGTRCFGATLAVALLSFTCTSSLAAPQKGFPLMDGETRVTGVLVRTEEHPPKWLLRLEEPVGVQDRKTNVVEVVVAPPGPAAPLTNGSRYEFTGRLDIQRNPALLRVSTIRRLDVSPSIRKLSKGKDVKP